MRLLLDTNVFLWAQAARARLGRARALIEDTDNELLVSAVSSWEITIKHSTGKLSLPAPPGRYVPDAIREIDAQPVAVEHAHALAVAELPPLHRDPFDRLLVAQAIALSAELVTGDAKLAEYPVRTIVV